MPKNVTILCLLQEIKYLKQQIYKTPQLTYVGYCQWESTRPTCPKGKYDKYSI